MKNLSKQIINIFKTLLTIIIFIIVPIVLFILITSRTSAILGIRSFVVLTGSMVPKIPVYSLVITKPANNYYVGDIITFSRGNISVTHRIAAIKNGKYITKGDANRIDDTQLVNRSDIIGKDYFIFPSIGKASEFLKTLPGALLFIVLPILTFIIMELFSIKSEIEKQVELKVRKQYEQRLET